MHKQCSKFVHAQGRLKLTNHFDNISNHMKEVVVRGYFYDEQISVVFFHCLYILGDMFE